MTAATSSARRAANICAGRKLRASSEQSLMSVVAAWQLSEKFDAQVPLLIIGAGAAGLCAALAAKEAGVEPVMIERDAVPSGSTALSAGLIPAAGTRFQRAKGIVDSAAIVRRRHPAQGAWRVRSRGRRSALRKGAGPLVEWLADRYGLPFDVVDNFNYPGHSALRMHGLPTRTGLELIDRAAQRRGSNDIVILTGRVAERLFGELGRPHRGVEVAARRRRARAHRLRRADPRLQRLWRQSGVGAPLHSGNGGRALFRSSRQPRRCRAVGRGARRKLAHLGAYQGHGSVATPHNILITWAVIMQGGIQINADGRRFCDESRGYSEQAADVLRQPGGVAWDVFDERIAAVARQFEDFRDAERAGAVVCADTAGELGAGDACAGPESFRRMARGRRLEILLREGSLRAVIRARAKMRGAVICGKSDWCAFSYAGRLGDRRKRAGAEKDGWRFPEFVCRGRCGGRRIGFKRCRLPVGKRTIGRNSPRATCRRHGGASPTADRHSTISLIARRVAALGVKGFEVKIQPSVQDHLAYVIETSAVAPVRLRRAWVRA